MSTATGVCADGPRCDVAAVHRGADRDQAAVGRHAGVSAESTYKGFGTKAEPAEAVFDLAVGG